jgi:hypothetical protein
MLIHTVPPYLSRAPTTRALADKNVFDDLPRKEISRSSAREMRFCFLLPHAAFSVAYDSDYVNKGLKCGYCRVSVDDYF